MPIYKGGQSQFGLHEAANEQDMQPENDADFNARVASRNPKLFDVASLQEEYKDSEEGFPMGGAGLAKGKREKDNK